MTNLVHTTPSFFEKVISGAKSLAMRVVVHMGALLCGLAATTVTPENTLLAAFFGTYTGLVCLIGPDIRLKLPWLAPTFVGVLQAFLCFACGLPFYQSIFWGGFQTWLQHTFIKRFDIGYHWATLLLLLPGCISLGAGIASSVIALGSFIGLLLGGALFWRYPQLSRLVHTSLNGAPHNPLQAQTTVTLMKHEQTQEILQEFHDSVKKLRTKQILLPPNMQASIKSLAASATCILSCMAEDGRDIEPGRKFLKRYLAATHDVLDKYQRLRRDSFDNPEAAQALIRSEDILVRLEQAFLQEHEALLRNNLDDFSADLNVLDTLLKMEGR